MAESALRAENQCAARKSTEVARRPGPHRQVEAFETVGDERDDSLGGLHLPADQQCGAGPCDQALPLPHC